MITHTFINGIFSSQVPLGPLYVRELEQERLLEPVTPTSAIQEFVEVVVKSSLNDLQKLSYKVRILCFPRVLYAQLCMMFVLSDHKQKNVCDNFKAKPKIGTELFH